MKKLSIIFIFSMFVTVLMAEGVTNTPLAYTDCYKIALANSDAVKIESERLTQANAAKLKSFGALLPTITLDHEREFGINGSLYSDQGWISSITATQPVFHGLEKINAISVFDREAYREELNLISTKRALAQSTADAYYTLAQAQADQANIQDGLTLLNQRVAELRQWQELGKSRLSEVYATESTAALLAAELEQAKASADGASDALSRVLGIEYQVTVVQPAESADIAENISVTFTAENRSEVLAQKAEVEASDKRIAAGLGTLLPQVDLSVSKDIGGSPLLGTTAYNDKGWQFMLLAQWPLFEGGSRVFDSISAFSQREAAYRQYISTFLDVKYELRSRLRDYAASAKIVAAMKDAYSKASQSLKAQQSDYKFGLVTNVDVLQAMSNNTSVKQSLDRAIIQRELDRQMVEISAEAVK